MYLLDTNICIYIINKHPIHVVERIKKLQPHEIKISAISIAELEYGASKSKKRKMNRNALLHFASAFDIVAFNDGDAEIFGLIRASLEKKGTIIGPYDLQIASQAISRNLTLVTNNIKEFERVENLKLENWV
ncbi:MAG: type II toxin-antitoxin system VapC family toxin [Sphaerochaeta sp.]|nr:type II toxin-antitoxin system VapC family toxin [Sphaerochaeta sp.]